MKFKLILLLLLLLSPIVLLFVKNPKEKTPEERGQIAYQETALQNSGKTEICARDLAPQIEAFLKEVDQQVIYRTEVSPCGEIIGKTKDWQSIGKIIEFAGKLEPRIKINLGQHSQP